ncbi:hypothetical protein A9Q96_08505 [Rhodobacterales bacterium 52_120_T64]|nr:hypothetical protein A9Q96_08505 [Rhodobacterales bacterium 52_120_T64]
MQPVLALELSSDGILLHELSYDGVWRRISAAALSDPYLPKKMVAMKQAARASQGRFFKNQVWLPREQIRVIEVKLAANDPDERQAEAEAIVRNHPEFSDGEYLVQFGEEDVNGNVKIATVNRAILQEASRFASGYGFSTDGFTSRDRIDGFYQQPIFAISAPPKIAVNYAKIGFFTGVGAILAAVIAGGYWGYKNIDFAPDPSVAIEATEERILEIDEDPRAPIRPTDVAKNAEHLTPDIISFDDNLELLPEHDLSITIFEALVEQAPLASSLKILEVPDVAAPLSVINASTVLPRVQQIASRDNLPAPETAGFPVVATKAIAFEDSAASSEFAGGTAIVRFVASALEAAYVSSPRLTDVLPRDDSTVVLSAQLRKFNDSLGLTQVRNHNAAMAQRAQLETLQQAPVNLIGGRPTILPVLRDGVEISHVPLPPPPARPPTLTIAELQALAPIIVQGFPRITPLLRDGRNVADLPQIPEPAVDNNPVPADTGSDGEPLVQFTTVSSGLTTAQLQLIPPRVFQGRPAIVPLLRGGVKVDAITHAAPPPEETDESKTLNTTAEATRIAALQTIPANPLTGRLSTLPLLRDGDNIVGDAGITAEEPQPEPTEAQRLRPLSRPDSVELTAIVASLSQQAVPSTLAPRRRPAGFADSVQEMADAIAEEARVTPTFTDAPRQVNVPTSANVARTATIENGINLRETSLIGVFGTPGNYRALLRQRGGKYQMLEVGAKIDSWTIVAIAESEVRLKKGSKTKTLKLPAEG